MIRKTNFKTICYSLLLFIFCAPVMAAPQAPRDPAEFFFDQTLGDFSEELEVAQEDGKKAILFMFEDDDCPWCLRMKKTILNQPRVQDYFKQNFLIFTVDIEGDVEITDFNGEATTMKDFSFKQNRVRATPVFAFYGLDGKPIKRGRYTGVMKNEDDFLLFGQFIVDKVYEKMSFTRYKRTKK